MFGTEQAKASCEQNGSGAHQDLEGLLETMVETNAILMMKRRQNVVINSLPPWLKDSR
jgi:hypothetical protein